ncbi:MAG: PIN domain-containing protein [Streptosporangiales bacterium]|nr:PIN domain-containing protein [Streptosporangiales bacterium]
MVIYVDTSAFVKLVWAEPESEALQHFLAERRDAALVSSVLLTVETRRAVLREDPSQISRADLLLTRVGQVAITRALVEVASRFPDPHLRTLDAIHLATALQLRGDVEAFVTYDRRLAPAAKNQGLVITTPGGEAS